MKSSWPWIPPLPLVLAQLAHGFSWLLIFWAAWSGNFENPLYAFAWIHTVALGWITTAALAILIFAVPQFTGARWAGERLARAVSLLLPFAAAFFVYTFLDAYRLLALAASIVAALVFVYLATGFATVARGMQAGERVERAVARAFGGTFAFLAAAAALGAAMAIGHNGGPAHAHAHLATIGWITLLIFGVSMRTLRPITLSGGTRFRWMHILVGSFGALGAVLLALGAVRIGGALFAIAAAGYALDVFDMLLRAKNPHRPPQAFVAASVLWLLCAIVFGAGVLLGRRWEGVYVFVLLAGWAGQMVNAHLHHIGIRLLSTIYRGEDDETPPEDLLETRLSWYSFVVFQLAVAAVAAALLQDRAPLAARGAAFGLTAWIAMSANVLVARRRAMALRT